MVSSTSSGSPASNALGTIGGVLLSICLMPQLYRIYKTRSTTDISLYYTLTYAAGLAFNLAYLVLENALVGWIFITVELALALVVIAAKLWLERGGRGKRDAEAKRKFAEQLEKENLQFPQLVYMLY